MRRDVVAVGASAGGIRALRTLVRGLPANFEAPVVIVQHLSAESPGLLPEILAQGAQLRVSAASDGAPLETGRVHVAIPNHHLLIDSSGRLRLSRGPKENRSRPAIDPMFRSAALAFGARVIGVVLTGYLNDGSAGLKAVKLCGGACVVQDPKEAEAPSMPLSALRLVPSARQVAIEKLPALLTSLVGSAAEKEPPMAKHRLRELEIEAAIAAGDQDALRGTRTLGKPSPLTCPDCHGALFEITSEPSLKRYRCHTGHAFTADSLLASIEESTENMLWSAVRALQEKAILLHHLATHAEALGDVDRASTLRSEAELAKKSADHVRQVEQHEMR